MNLLPIPWMKLKLESIYDVNLYGNLYLIFNDINNSYNIDTNSLSNLLVDHNILVDDSHPLYLYLPMELNDQIYKLMTSFKYLYKDNIYIILGGYKDTYPNLNELDCLANLCSKYENLDSIVNYSYLIDNDKTYDTSASVNGYKVTATSGSLTQDWTNSYKYILNATSKTLTAIQGRNGSTTGDASFEYTLKSPSISNANVTTALNQKHTVHLYCYGKSYYNA